MSDRIISIAQVYMAAYSCDITVLAALFLGVGIGAFVFYGYGKDVGTRVGYEEGFSWARSIGFRAGYVAGQQKKRNAKGQFTK